MTRKSTTGRRRAVDRKQSSRKRNPVKKQKRVHQSVSPDVSRAIGSLFRAAREAQQLSQDQVAAMTSGKRSPVSRTTVSSVERGVHLPGADVLVSLARVLNVEPVEVFERIELEMTQPVDLTGRTRENLFSEAEEFFWAGDYRRALATYDALLQHLVLDPPADERERARLHARIEINRATALHRCCALSASRAAAERAISIATDFPHLQAEAYVVLCGVLYRAGLLPFASDAADHAVRLSENESPKTQGWAWIVKGDVLYMTQHFEEATQAFTKARGFVKKARDEKHLIQVEGNLGACWLELRKRGQARKAFTKAVELARKHTMPAAEAFWLVELGLMSLDDGQLDKADSYGEAALRIAKPTAQLLTIFRAEWLRHRVVMARSPKSADARRMAYLRKLYPQIKEHRGLRVVQEYEKAVVDRGGQGGPDE
ncbi:MAG: helix-turn-helix domain-containing protein [bacterium]|nr:helix-turn-helix domain-containing protein [bacterium]